METIKYAKMDKKQIINTLMKGGLLAFPTDTVFGLACMMDEKAIKKVYEVKGRSFDKPLPMMCCDLKMIESVAIVDEKTKKLIKNFMPGPITIIFKKKDCVKDYVTQGKDTIGIRVPDDEFILELIKDLKKPLMVTSANISGAGSLLKWEDVYKDLSGKIEAIVCEDASGDSASTIVDVSDGLKILREGPISIEEIKEVIE